MTTTNKPVVIASFDVGVKNLAFCVMKYDPNAPSGSQFPISLWKCFDLTDNTGIGDRICEGQKANGTQCNNGAKILTDNDEAYCGVHNPDKERYKPRKERKIGSYSYEQLGNALMDRLDALKSTWDTVDHVIIEQQFNKNRKMIFLSAILFSYFMQAGQRQDDSKIKRVKFASSRNKLKVYDGPKITEQKYKDAKRNRKWLAPKHCEYLIREDTEHLSFFKRYPRKKDDLADCFLQGADYLKNECRACKRPTRKKTAKKIVKKKQAKKQKE